MDSKPAARYRHYQNRGKGGDDVFVTTTCLDFARLFARPEIRTQLAEVLLRHCRQRKVVLHAYAIMSHHVHFVARMPEGMTVSRFVQRFKTDSAKLLLPKLQDSEVAQLGQQRGLDSRQFWQRSFRSLVLERDRTLMQKIGYVNANPQEAGMVQRAEEYIWSSARAFTECRWSYLDGCLTACLEHLKARKPPD